MKGITVHYLLTSKIKLIKETKDICVFIDLFSYLDEQTQSWEDQLSLKAIVECVQMIPSGLLTPYLKKRTENGATFPIGKRNLIDGPQGGEKSTVATFSSS